MGGQRATLTLETSSLWGREQRRRPRRCGDMSGACCVSHFPDSDGAPEENYPENCNRIWPWLECSLRRCHSLLHFISLFSTIHILSLGFMSLRSRSRLSQKTCRRQFYQTAPFTVGKMLSASPAPLYINTHGAYSNRPEITKEEAKSQITKSHEPSTGERQKTKSTEGVEGILVIFFLSKPEFFHIEYVRLCTHALRLKTKTRTQCTEGVKESKRVLYCVGGV